MDSTPSRRLGVGTAILLITFGALLAIAPGFAHASHVACGDTITQDTTLDSDLTCARSGLIIGADGVTLDLNSHDVVGDIRTLYEREYRGSSYLTGANDVTVEDGTVRNGVIRIAGDFSAVRDLRLSGAGLTLTKQPECSDCLPPTAVGNVVERVVSDGGGGIRLTGQHEFTLRNNRVNGASISVLTGRNGEISANSLVNGGIGLNFSALISVADNSILGNGVSLLGASGNSVSGNRIVGGQVGVSLSGTRATCWIGLSGASAHNDVARNRITHAAQDGIFVSGPLKSHCDDSVNPTTYGTTLVDNRVKRNGDDGIDVEEPSTTLTRNRANRNGDLGIEAVPGVTDGGKNRAFGNGNPLQCLNVACK